MEIYRKGGGIASLKILGTINCSSNPDYPAGNAGDIYIVSAAGYIGGDPSPSPDNGQAVSEGDFIVCEVDGTPSGTHASVGANWTIIEASTSINYTNLTPTISSLGGIGIGETFVNKTMKEMWDKLLYPYLGPLVSLASNPTSGYREYGDVITSTVLTPTTTKRSNPITTLTLSRSGVGVIYTYPSPNPSGGTEASYTDTNTVSTTTTFTATVGDGTSTSTSTKTYTFIYPYLYGKGPHGLTGSQMYSTFTKVVSPPTNNLTLSFSPSSERVYLAVPPSSTAYTQVLDQNLFDVSADFLPSSTISITGLDGTPQTYTVYEINHDIGDGSTISFTFKY